MYVSESVASEGSQSALLKKVEFLVLVFHIEWHHLATISSFVHQFRFLGLLPIAVKKRG